MAAAEQYAPHMVPTLAEQFFAGLRPGEAKGLKWEDINWSEKTIRVMPETS
jgi:integrase